MRALLHVLTAAMVLPAVAFAGAAGAWQPELPMEVRVLVIQYFPVKGDRIDGTVTGDWGEPLGATRTKCAAQTKAVIHALQEGSRYHAYRDEAAKPSLACKILDVIEYLEPLPTVGPPGQKAPMTDYNKIMRRVNIKQWVEEKGVREVWIWGYHGGVVGLWESNMAGPFGDISNSSRDPKDLPVLTKTYTEHPEMAESAPVGSRKMRSAPEAIAAGMVVALSIVGAAPPADGPAALKATAGWFDL